MVHGGRLVAGLRPGAPLGEALADLPKATRCVTVAHHLARSLAGAGMAAVVIPNSVDLGHFRPDPPSPALRQALGLGPNALVVLHASNLRQLKGVPDLIRSAARVAREEARATYVIVGDGHTRRDLEDLCRAQELTGRVRFVGEVEHAHMPGYLRLADLVVHPSAIEGQSLVCLEAQACGRPVLASDIPGARELIRDGDTGFLFRAGDVADLAARTLAVLRDPAGRAVVGARARAAAVRRARPPLVRQYEAVLRAAAGYASSIR
jgi:glycosyltransferase involved in cell wall biosynthesis